MWIWDKLTKAEIIKTDDTLKVNTIQLLGIFLVMLLCYFPMAIFMQLGFDTIAIFFGLIFFISILTIIPTGIKDYYNSENIVLHKNGTMEVVRYIFRYKQQFQLINAPFFINISVKPLRNNIKITIENNGLKIGHYTLKDSEDLTQLIDGFTTFLDLELVESQQLTKGEVLSFKSQNINIPNPTSLQIEWINNRLSFKSIQDVGLWLEFDFNRKTIRKYNKSFDLSDVSRIYIESRKKYLDVNLLLKSTKKVRMLRHKTSEINILRDANRLKETLENRPELQEIEVELFDYS